MQYAIWVTPRYGVRPFVFKCPDGSLVRHYAALGFYALQDPHQFKELESNAAGIVACGCNIYPYKVDTERKPANKQKKKKVRAGIQTSSRVQYPASAN